MNGWRIKALINLGLWGPPLLWAATLQLGQILPHVDCARRSHSLAWIAFGAVISAVLAGISVWRVAGRSEGRETHFLASVSALSSAVFTFALLLQTIATLVLTGCEK